MKAIFRALAALPVWLLLVALCPSSAQTLGTSRKKIPDQADADLQQMLNDGQAYLDQKDFQGAAEKYSEYLAQKPDDAYAHFQLGFAYTALHEPDKAEPEYRRATELDPSMAPAFLNLGLTLLPKAPASALPPLQKAADLLPDDPRPRFELGAAFDKMGQTSSAIEQFQQAVSLGPKNPETHMALGRELLHAQEAADAESEFRKALDLQPQLDAARLGLIQSLVVQKKSDEASAQLGEYLKSHPEDTDAHFERASLLVGQGKNDDALAELDQAAKVAPETLQAIKLRASIDLQKKDWDAAAVALQKAAALAPQDLEIQAEIGHVWLEKKNYSQAASVLVAVVRANPQFTDALKDLLTTEYLAGNYPATLQLLDLLDKQETPTVGSWFIRATCYDKIGKAKEALDGYRKFLELNAGKENDEYFVASSRARTLEHELKDKH